MGKIPRDGREMKMSVEVQERVALWRVPDPTEPPLTPEEEADVERARERFAQGDYLTLEELRRQVSAL